MYGIRIDGIRNAGMQEKENLILESVPPFMPSSSERVSLHREIIIPFHRVPASASEVMTVLVGQLNG
jgi:hypothetical protein